MSVVRRRSFCRALGGLVCFGLGGCKIEPILGVTSEEQPRPLAFPDLPPQIPDQLEDAETTLRALTEELLQREIPLLTSGSLRERPSRDPVAVSHFVDLMRRFGLDPAGNRGDWVQPVLLEVVEPTGDVARILLRPEAELPPDPGPQPDPSPTPAEPTPGEASPPTGETPAPEPSRAIDLGVLGAFRQRGEAAPLRGLLLGPVRSYETPLPTDLLRGRVAVLRAPKELDLASADAPNHIDMLFSSVREAGAVGCLLLTKDEGPGIERFADAWRRQLRRAGEGEQAMLIEGLVAGGARKAIEAALGDEDTWVLDVNLATRSYELESYNILGRMTGREHPREAVVLTCAWDTPDPELVELDSIRLLATLGAFYQLAEWSRRSAAQPYSLVLLLTADAGLAAGQSVHASWSANYGAETAALLALDRPVSATSPAVGMSGHYDPSIAELAGRVMAADGRELLLDDQLSMPELAPYLRYPAPVMTIGAPDPEALAELGLGEGDRAGDDEGNEAGATEDPLEGLHANIRLLRNMMLALATRR